MSNQHRMIHDLLSAYQLIAGITCRRIFLSALLIESFFAGAERGAGSTLDAIREPRRGTWKTPEIPFFRDKIY